MNILIICNGIKFDSVKFDLFFYSLFYVIENCVFKMYLLHDLMFLNLNQLYQDSLVLILDVLLSPQALLATLVKTLDIFHVFKGAEHRIMFDLCLMKKT